MFPPVNLLFVQSPSVCFNKSSTVCFLLTIAIRSCFIRSLEFARVNNSGALTDAKLSLDVFEKMSSDLALMSAIQSVITFPAISQCWGSFHSLQIFFTGFSTESLISALGLLKESRQECNIPGQISLLYLGDSIFNFVSEGNAKLILHSLGKHRNVPNHFPCSRTENLSPYS